MMNDQPAIAHIGIQRWSFVVVLGLGALAFIAATLTLRVAPPPACDIGANSDLACARGMETRERDGQTSFRWSDGYAEIHLAATGYGAPTAVELRLRSGRPAGTAPVPARFGLNGHLLAEVAVPAENRRYTLLLPSRPLVGDLARLQIASATWRPDVRTLGLVLLEARTHLPGGLRWPGPLLVLAWTGLLLAAHIATGGRPAWSFALPLLLLPMAALTPLNFYLPFVALITGGVALVMRRWGISGVRLRMLDWQNPALPMLLVAILYPVIITGLAPAWATLPLLLGCAALAVLAADALTRSTRAPSTILLMALLLRLIFLGARLLSNTTALDGDVELFYAYGMALREIGLPQVEYPSGALLPWALLSWLSGASREVFALLLPLLNIACDVLIVAALLRLAACIAATPVVQARGQWGDRFQLAPAAFYALSPLLEPFIFAKYDALPAALAIGGLALFAARRPGLAGLALGIGATIKWTPILAVPFLGLYLLQRRRWGDMWRFSALLGVGITAFSLPFAVSNPANFVLPYQLQGGRAANAESVWLPVALLFDPDLPGRIGAPWGAFQSEVLPLELLVGVQLAALALTGLITLLRPPDLRRTLTLAALAPALFLMLNRVFSPQYMLPISASLLAALTLVVTRPTALRAALALLALAQVANLLVWPFFSPHWIAASTILFVVLLTLSAWLIWRAGSLGRMTERVGTVREPSLDASNNPGQRFK